MRIVIQRVSKASVHIDGHLKAMIQKGMMVLLGIEENDTLDDVQWLCNKLINLRIFPDENGVMNYDVITIRASILVVSQFTLHASTKKGNRPSYIRAANPTIAVPLYESFLEKLKNNSQLEVVSGEFGAMMQVELINDGPVTIIMDSKNRE